MGGKQTKIDSRCTTVADVSQDLALAEEFVAAVVFPKAATY
jgi:hypothetical protein